MAAFTFPQIVARLRDHAPKLAIQHRYRIKIAATDRGYDYYLASGVFVNFGAQPVDCTVELDSATLVKLINDPSSVVVSYALGKIKASDVNRAIALGEALSKAVAAG